MCSDGSLFILVVTPAYLLLCGSDDLEWQVLYSVQDYQEKKV
jgi:hypothetical protein